MKDSSSTSFLICATWLFQPCDVTHSYLWHESVICVLLQARHDISSLRIDDGILGAMWLLHMSDMTHSGVGWNSLIRCPWLRQEAMLTATHDILRNMLSAAHNILRNMLTATHNILCNMLTATHYKIRDDCNTLQHTATHTLPATHWNATALVCFGFVRKSRNILTATHCNTHIDCNTLQHTHWLQHTDCNTATLQHTLTATHCNTHMDCNTLQYSSTVGRRLRQGFRRRV